MSRVAQTGLSESGMSQAKEDQEKGQGWAYVPVIGPMVQQGIQKHAIQITPGQIANTVLDHAKESAAQTALSIPSTSIVHF